MSASQDLQSTNKGRLVLILGSGPGIGVHVAAQFASNGFNSVALVARDAERLKQDAESVRRIASSSRSATTHARDDDDELQRGVKVRTYAADLTDTQEIEKTLQRVLDECGVPEVVVYNAARVVKSAFWEYDADEMEVDWKITTRGLYTSTRILAPHLTSLASSSQANDKNNKKKPNPTILITLGGIHTLPSQHLFSLSASKASQRNLAVSLYQHFRPKGVKVASVVVHGEVARGNGIFDPGRIGEVFWRVYEEEQQAGEEEKDGEGEGGRKKRKREMREEWIVEDMEWEPPA